MAGGAACLSVLTDADFFGGSPADLAPARQASGLPVLRKDFTVQEADVADARLMGADAVLLIVAALDDDELRALRRPGRRARAGRAGRGARRARSSTGPSAPGPRLVGVNQRDLRTFEVDHERACALAARIPADVVAVAESGIRDADDARRLADAGYDAILVGETLVRAGDRAGAAARAGRASRRDAMSGGPLRQDLRHHLGSRRAARGQPRGLGRRASSSPPRRGRSRCSWPATSPSGCPSTC